MNHLNLRFRQRHQQRMYEGKKYGYAGAYSDFMRNDARTYDLVVFSHLRWEFVTQRPQHIISRFARDRKILFVEEPISDGGDPGTAKEIPASEAITVLQPRISPERMTEEIVPIVNRYLDEHDFSQPIFWFYSPAFGGILDRIGAPSLVVYDCMDELSAFKGAPKSLIEEERTLLSRADVVFTGGRRLHEAKSRLHDNVHCFQSSVDRRHFEKAFKGSRVVPADIADIPHPIAGFYGVIDERIDLDLLSDIAERMPSTSFVMIGPVVKISEENLPRARNIHYLGAKPYEELPNYLGSIDVAIMPFALNDSTKFISPTKTLEFMAAHKPIVSTAVHDVARNYPREVIVTRTPAEFASSILRYSRETKISRAFRETLQEAVLAKTSWDRTVRSMKEIIAEAMEKAGEDLSLRRTRSFMLSHSKPFRVTEAYD